MGRKPPRLIFVCRGALLVSWNRSLRGSSRGNYSEAGLGSAGSVHFLWEMSYRDPWLKIFPNKGKLTFAFS